MCSGSSEASTCTPPKSPYGFGGHLQGVVRSSGMKRRLYKEHVDAERCQDCEAEDEGSATSHVSTDFKSLVCMTRELGI